MGVVGEKNPRTRDLKNAQKLIPIITKKSPSEGNLVMPSNGSQPLPSGSRPHGHHQPSQHRSKRRRRNHSEVSCCLKYVIFGFNVIFWLIGLSILAIGVWAWTEKDTFNNLSLLTNVALDPAFIFIWAGKTDFFLNRRH